MRLEVKKAGFAYPGGRFLFRDLSFVLEEQSILTILGRNGVGKTTLLKCIMGILHLSEGDLLIDGRTVESALHEKGIAYVPQAHDIPFAYTVRDIVTMGRARYMGMLSVPSAHDHELADKAIKEVGMWDFRDRPCGKLSGGQLQMVFFARALAAEPEILIMDEPESHLDFFNQSFVMDMISDLVKDRGISVMINTHFPEHALALDSMTLMMGEGRYCFGKTRDVITEENFRDYFDINAVIGSLQQGDISVPAFAVAGRL